MQKLGLAIPLFFVLVCVGCSSPPPMIVGPTSVRPEYFNTNIEKTGAIFQVGSMQLFEDTSVRYVGDIIKVSVSETFTSSEKTTANTSRDTSLQQKGPGSNAPLGGLFGSIFNIDANASGSNSFKGSGQTENNNTLNGSLMVSVIEILSNGNLVIAGEKKISMNGDKNTLRLTGVVKKQDIHAGVVDSSNIADVRIEQVGEGETADANKQTGSQSFFRSLFSFW